MHLPAPLDDDEINECFKRMQSGDITSRNKIIEHNIAFVIYKVNEKFWNTKYDIEDLVEIGIEGLIRSVDTFDINRNIKFSTYSRKFIVNEVLMFIRKNKKNNNVSLDEIIAINKNWEEQTLYDRLNDDASDFIAEIEESELYKVIREVIERLPEERKNIIIQYFGFNNNPKYQSEIANELGISQAEVSRSIDKTIIDLSNELKVLGIIENSKINHKRKRTVKKIKTLYEMFNKYTREQVDEMLSKLDDEDKKLLTLRYGNDLDNPTISEEWNDETYTKFYGSLTYKMENLLKDPNYVYKSQKQLKKK